MKKFKVLHRNVTIGGNSGTIVEIVEFNGGKFKITSDIHNGGKKINVMKMDSEGIFHLVLSNIDLPTHSEDLSYVSDSDKKIYHLDNTLKAIKDVIVKVYY